MTRFALANVFVDENKTRFRSAFKDDREGFGQPVPVDSSPACGSSSFWHLCARVTLERFGYQHRFQACARLRS